LKGDIFVSIRFLKENSIRDTALVSDFGDFKAMKSKVTTFELEILSRRLVYSNLKENLTLKKIRKYLLGKSKKIFLFNTFKNIFSDLNLKIKKKILQKI